MSPCPLKCMAFGGLLTSGEISQLAGHPSADCTPRAKAIYRPPMAVKLDTD